MKHLLTAATVLSVLVAGHVAAQSKAPPAAASVSDGRQSIRIGATTIPRPFGSELVDRLQHAGTFRLGNRRFHLVRGDTVGTSCRSRYVFITEQRGAQPVVSAPFGTCSGDARVIPGRNSLTVTMSQPIADLAGARKPPLARFAFDGTIVRPLSVAAVSSSPSCVPAAQLPPSSQDEVLSSFERDYPLAYRNTGDLRRALLDQAELEELVTALACLAPWPAADRRIPKLATPLFASRHGPAAFAALEAIAVAPASNAHLRASASSFAAEMRYRVGRREPL